MNQKSKQVDINKMDVQFCEFDESFRECSWRWTNDPLIKSLIDAPTITEEEQIKWFEQLKKRDDYKIWGVKYHGKNVGAVGLKHIDHEKKQAEYFGYIGEPAFWGKGIGSIMVEFVFTETRKLKLDNIYLKVLKNNERAIGLYMKFGYLLETISEREYLMRKNLLEK